MGKIPRMQILSNEHDVNTMIDRLADAVGHMMENSEGEWAFVGIRNRGDIIGEKLAQKLNPKYVGTVDITLYRDDLSEIGAQPIVQTTEIDFPLDGTNILLIDDVLNTGRSVRAAIQSIIDYGRPKCIRLLVLVDRGGNELPIAADLAGDKIQAGDHEQIDVRLKETDGETCIVKYDKQDKRK